MYPLSCFHTSYCLLPTARSLRCEGCFFVRQKPLSPRVSRDAGCVMTVTSCNNAKVKWVRSLRNRKDREQSGLCFVEGLHLARAAVANGIPLELLVLCWERVTIASAHEFIHLQRSSGVPLLEVTAEVFDSLAAKENGQGIGIVARQRWNTLEQFSQQMSRCWVALEGVQYPGNLGTILRTADAVGCSGVLLLDNATDPYDPASARASMGAVFAQPLVRARSSEFQDWVARHHLCVVGATPSAPQDYRNTTYPLPLVLLMGRERGGLSPELASLCECTVRIPMVGQCDSLNLAVSTGVLLYGIFGQHHPAGKQEWESGAT